MNILPGLKTLSFSLDYSRQGTAITLYERIKYGSQIIVRTPVIEKQIKNKTFLL